MNFYKHIVDAVQEGIWIVGTDGSTIFVNSQMAAILGSTVEKLSDRSLQAYADGENGLFAATQRIGQGLGNSTIGEWQLHREDGTTLWVQASVSPLYNDNGKLSGTLTLLIDITTHRRVENKSRFQAHLLDMAGHAVLVIDRDGQILYRNQFTDRLYGPFGTAAETMWTKELSVIIRISRGKHWASELLIHCWDGSTFPAKVTTFPIYNEQNQKNGTLIAIVDITSRQQTEKSLERYVKRLENLRAIDRAILTSRSAESIAQAVINNIHQFVLCSRASVSLYDFQARESVLLAVYTVIETSLPAGDRSPLNQLELPTELLEGKTYITDDVVKFPGAPQHFRTLKAEGIRAYVRVPLMVQGNLIGSLNMASEDISTFTPESLDVAREIADQLAVALQNAQLVAEVRQHAAELEGRVAERTHELATTNEQLQQEIRERRQIEAAEHEQRAFAEALQDTATALNSTLNLDEVLDRILANVVRVVQHDVSNISFVEDGTTRIVRSRGYGDLGIKEAALTKRWVVANVPFLKQMSDTRQPAVISDAHMQHSQENFAEFQSLYSGVGAPIQSGGEVIGFINLGSTTPEFFTTVHAERLKVFADQAAVAIQNARLYERSRQVAILEERQRLSHELHDSVSQTLWSASLLADVLPELWEQDNKEGRQTLAKLRQLTRGALAEMRTLLLELHPTALIEVDFGELLRRLAEVTTSRTSISVSPVLEGQPALPPDVQIALYRIVQEALSNTVRHSAATQIAIHMRCTAQQMELRIKDNGRGFVPDRLRPGHLGVGIMQERAREINAELRIDSQIGEGTEICVIWPANKEAKRDA